jgi:hypothetical protein
MKSRLAKFHRDVWRKARSKRYRPPGSEVGPELRKNWATGSRDNGHPRHRGDS